MGLAGPKHRRKLGEDPNNTKWSRDSSTFGQKILRAHGWQPGQYLGNQDADSSLRSAASSAPIKILLKDDNLGLGAKIRQKQSDECTGLDTFKDLLGRLNGKSEEVIEKERAVRSEFKTSLYVERRFGLMRFVKGGMLVGDPISDYLKNASSTKDSDAGDSKDVVTAIDGTFKVRSKKEKKSKKRRVEDSDNLEIDTVKEKHFKKKKRTNAEHSVESVASDSTTEESEKKGRHKKHHKGSTAEEDDDTVSGEKKSRKDRKRKDEGVVVEDDANTGKSEGTDADGKKKKKKRKHHHHHHSEASSGDTSTVEDTAKSTIASPLDSGASTPITSGTSTPSMLSNRHLARSRYVAAKRLALADAQALNQIFMVKPV